MGRWSKKANFNPEQPRQPGPGPGTGQWIFVEGYAQERDSDASIILANSPGIGHNNRPRLDQPPEVPKQPPTEQVERLAKAKEAAKWLAAFGVRRIPAVAAALAAIEAAEWLRSEWPSITSYRDATKTMDELIGGAQQAKPGYHRHHIVEQTPAGRDGFARSLIDGANNVVSVPIYKHRRLGIRELIPISETYRHANISKERIGGERVRVGQLSLRKFEVLKP